MIIHIFFSIIILLFNTIVSWLPSVSALPFGMDSFFVTMVSVFKGSFVTFPYFEVVWNCFTYILGFEVFMIVLKIFLGSRVPTNHHIN